MLGPMEEAAMTDEANLGWSEKLLHVANDESEKDTMFVSARAMHFFALSHFHAQSTSRCYCFSPTPADS